MGMTTSLTKWLNPKYSYFLLKRGTHDYEPLNYFYLRLSITEKGGSIRVLLEKNIYNSHPTTVNDFLSLASGSFSYTPDLSLKAAQWHVEDVAFFLLNGEIDIKMLWL